jgi:hypothetical protein
MPAELRSQLPRFERCRMDISIARISELEWEELRRCL